MNREQRQITISLGAGKEMNMSDTDDLWRQIGILKRQVDVLTKLTASLCQHRHDCSVSTAQSSTPIYPEKEMCPEDGKECDKKIKTCCSCARAEVPFTDSK